MRQYRQGDIFLQQIGKLPNGTRRMDIKDRIVLAYGEATGHAHAIAVEDDVALLEKGDTRFLEVASPAKLRHEEHGTIVIEPGTYEVIRQREWSDENEPRQVAD